MLCTPLTDCYNRHQSYRDTGKHSDAFSVHCNLYSNHISQSNPDKRDLHLISDLDPSQQLASLHSFILTDKHHMVLAIPTWVV